MNETESIDTAIEQVERLYRSVTGQQAPPVGEQPYATIPPEKVPEEHVQEQVDRLVETLASFSTSGRIVETEWKPPIAVWEGKDELVIDVDLPGSVRDQVQVTVDRGLLQIHGTRRLPETKNGNERDLRYVEHPYGRFRRTIPIPHAARVDQLQANMRDGVLEIRIPKRETSESRSIPVA
jgi:HSP20 family protein